MLVFPEIISEHAEEIAFLYAVRENALYSPAHRANHILEHWTRLHAHINGITLNGNMAIAACKDRFFLDDPGELFCLAVVQLLHHRDLSIEIVEAASSRWTHLWAIKRATELFSISSQTQLGQKCLTAHNKMLNALALLILPEDLINLETIKCTLQSDDELLILAALWRLTNINTSKPIQNILPNFSSASESIQFSSARALTISGDVTGLPILEKLVRENSIFNIESLRLLAAAWSEDSCIDLANSLAKDDDLRPLAARLVGYLGSPQMIPGLLRMLSDNNSAMLAADSISLICGIDLYRENLVIPSRNEEHPIHAMNLPNPDVDGLHKWWEFNQQKFPIERRFMLGEDRNSQIDALSSDASLDLLQYVNLLKALKNKHWIDLGKLEGIFE